MQIGFSQMDITPALGTRMAGQLMNYQAKGIESELFATAMCLKQGGVSVVFVSCDILLISNELATEIAGKAQKESGIPAENIILCATHTHSGPIVQDIFGMERDNRYVETLKSKILLCIHTAIQNSKEAVLYVSQGQAEGYAFNRRFLMSDGNIETHPLKGDPHIVKPEGPDSTNLDVFYACDTGEKPLGAAVVFGCHATVLERDNEMISSDYAGKVSSYVSSQLGGGIPVLFLQGASGNICQVNPLDTSRKEAGLEWAKIMGAGIGQKAMDGIQKQKMLAQGPLRVLTKQIQIPRRAVDPEILEWAYRHKEGDCELPVLSDYGTETYNTLKPPRVYLEQIFKTPFWADFYAKEIRTLERDRKRQPDMPLEIKVVAQDSWAMVTLPCELFVEWSLKVRENSPFEHTIVVELANGWNGYIPTRQAFERKGGYETKEVTSTMLIPEAGDMVLETVMEMLETVKNK